MPALDDDILQELLRTACTLTGARYAAIGVLADDRRRLARFVTRGLDDEARRLIGDPPHGRGVLGALIEDPRPLRLDDVGAHPSSYGFPAGHPPMTTFLGVPVLVRGEAWGNLYLTDKEGGGAFDDADEQAATVLARWAAIAIENARLFAEAQERRDAAERAVRRFEATTAIARAVGSETSLERVLELVVKRGRALAEARSVVLTLVEGDELVVSAVAGQVPASAVGARIPVEGSATGEVLRAGAGERVDDVVARLRIPDDRLGVAGAETAVLVPLVYRGDALGVLGAFDRMGDDPGFAEEDEQLLAAFAASAATAVMTARSVAADRLRHSLSAAEQERRRWARELHDDTLQALAGLRVLLASGLKGTDDVLRGAAEAGVAQLGEEIEGLRRLIAELRPAALDELGLGPALQTLLARTATIHGLEVVSDFTLADRLEPELETAVYRIVQEALTNVGRHARATSVRVQIAEESGWVIVVVHDDGVGFDPDAPAAGFGIMGIRERVALAGGALAVESSPQEGTTIVVRLRAHSSSSSPWSSA